MRSRWSFAIPVQVPAPDRADPDTVAGAFAPWARTSRPDPLNLGFGHAVTIESILIIRSRSAIRNPPGRAAFALEYASWFRSKMSRLQKRASLMSIAESAGRLSATVLLGKELTPGKMRGLQRISNPDGTLTMLALDQNSSVIEMATKALRQREKSASQPTMRSSRPNST